jgi:hypothetical protein
MVMALDVGTLSGYFWEHVNTAIFLVMVALWLIVG